MSCDASRRIIRRALTATALALGATSVLGSTNNFIVPAFRGQPESEFGFWEQFTVAYDAPGNTADQAGSTSGAILTQVLSPSAFTTGSGNIYDPSAPMSFTLTDVTPFTLGTVVLQIRTLGSELAYGDVQLSYSDGAGTQVLEPVVRGELDRGNALGASVSYLWQWDLRGRDVTDYTLSFGTPDSSLSLDAITLDAWNGFEAVPEPSSVALLLGGGTLMWLHRSRRR